MIPSERSSLVEIATADSREATSRWEAIPDTNERDASEASVAW